MWLEGIITYSIDYLTCLIPLNESFSIFWSVSESILAPILCVGWVKNGWPMRSSADPPILALKISLDGHFPSSYIKIEGKYTACAFNFCHLRPLLRYNRPWIKAPTDDFTTNKPNLHRVHDLMTHSRFNFISRGHVWMPKIFLQWVKSVINMKYHAHAENSWHLEKNNDFWLIFLKRGIGGRVHELTRRQGSWTTASRH